MHITHAHAVTHDTLAHSRTHTLAGQNGFTMFSHGPNANGGINAQVQTSLAPKLISVDSGGHFEVVKTWATSAMWNPHRTLTLTHHTSRCSCRRGLLDPTPSLPLGYQWVGFTWFLASDVIYRHGQTTTDLDGRERVDTSPMESSASRCALHAESKPTFPGPRRGVRDGGAARRPGRVTLDFAVVHQHS